MDTKESGALVELFPENIPKYPATRRSKIFGAVLAAVILFLAGMCNYAVQEQETTCNNCHGDIHLPGDKII